ncbi:MAG: hypothetical protein PHW53_05165 [Patescibacteria group bacterium]|nr:hypothetical protein [Patescibacteria group bacterium]
MRIKIISGTDDIASARVSVLKQHIEGGKLPFALHPNKELGWTNHKIFVERDAISKDPSVEGRGILSSEMGARVDKLVFDDPVDLKNAIQQPALRPQVKESFRNTWLSRLEPTGMVTYIGTVWHEDDLSMELLSNKRFSFLVMSVNKSMDGIECRYTNR